LNAQKQPDIINNWATIEGIVVCIIDTTEYLTSADLVSLKDVVLLTFQFPS
jgi:hypothetical protein